MSLLVLIISSLFLGLVALGAFFWALHNGQFEDPDGAAWRVIPADSSPHKKGQRHDHLASDASNDNTRGGL